MAALPLILMIATSTAAAAVTAVGAIKQGQAAEQASAYNAGVARQNAVIAAQQGELAAKQNDVQAERKIGAATAQYGAAGLDSSEGSPLDVLRYGAEQASLDSSTIRYNYALKSAGYEQNALIEDFSGKTAKENSYYNAAGSILGGGAKIADYGITKGLF